MNTMTTTKRAVLIRVTADEGDDGFFYETSEDMRGLYVWFEMAPY